ncbi:glycosyltransferase family 1 protein [Pontibacter oryzae]|uniref:Glycosyltransferase family 1 protein n=2 Tax=Pontibacter oryzae TaxID=2304593 RepID=A0A399SJK1_9BACT|nr:glycosyltransferase family 1 protein [Pontibacter oryzae]
MQSWDIGIGSNCKNIALELARTHKVLYVNFALDRFTAWRAGTDPVTQKRKAVLRQQVDDLEQVQENLWVLTPRVMLESINWLPPGWLFDKLNYRNNQLLAGAIQLAAKRLNFDSFVLLNDNMIERGLYLKELLKPTAYLYYLRDHLITVPYHRKHGKKAQELLIAKANAVVANSGYLASFAEQYNPKSFMVGQGCELEQFLEDGIAEAPELQNIPAPRIGYIGYLTALRLDLALLIGMAKQRPAWQFVLVGPEDEAFAQSELHSLPNVHFLGNKQPASLPKYLKGFDVALNPQLVNELTVGNYPRKIDEYLAMGKPTVSTATPFMEYFKDSVYLATDLEDFLRLIALALQEDDEARALARRETASAHSWENSVAAILNTLDNTLHKESEY